MALTSPGDIGIYTNTTRKAYVNPFPLKGGRDLNQGDAVVSWICVDAYVRREREPHK